MDSDQRLCHNLFTPRGTTISYPDAMDAPWPASSLHVLDLERLRIAHELHDSTGQLLVALSLSIARLQRQVREKKAATTIAEIGDIVRLIDKEVRTFSFLEYPAELNATGLGPTLAEFTRELARRSGLHIDCHFEIEGVNFDRKTALCLLRIAQEALINVHRHAGASQAHLTLTKRPRDLMLVVTDDGRGLGPVGISGERRGIGLDGMRLRAAQLGGEVEMLSRKNGTKIVARIPLRPAVKRGSKGAFRGEPEPQSTFLEKEA